MYYSLYTPELERWMYRCQFVVRVRGTCVVAKLRKYTLGSRLTYFGIGARLAEIQTLLLGGRSRVKTTVATSIDQYYLYELG